MRALALSTLFLVAAACGDNRIHSSAVDSGGTTDGPVCGDGVVSPGEDCETGACCADCKFAVFATECRAAAGSCDAAEVCDGLSAECPADEAKPDGTSCPQGFCSGGSCGACNSAVDADFDGANQCNDCDDTNGLVKPQANEQACEGLDDDCDGMIDEDYDADHDGYSTCSDDPLVRDCDDAVATTHPGAPELCGAGGTGNSKDDNCNGYVDETCQPCDDTDNDGDGLSECDGDCDDTRGGVGPNKAEVCDGFDTDCNRFTTENCDVSDPCHFATDDDVCKDDLQCFCILDENGDCLNDYRCGSFCEGSFTGGIGAGCTPTQTCMYRVLETDNQHACGETTATLGAKLGGETCAADNECRSGSCETFCSGEDCSRCFDFCDHDGGGAGSCGNDTVCEIVSGTEPPDDKPYMYAQCEVDDNGTLLTGEACNATNKCKWGTNACVNGTCAQPCGLESQCPSGTHCAANGNSVTTGTWSAGTATGVSGQPAIETVPVCLADGAGAHDRQGGAACTANGQCTSEFCDKTLHVCVDMCTTDASCGVGLTCEPLYVRPGAAGTGIFWGRACVNDSFGELLERM